MTKQELIAALAARRDAAGLSHAEIAGRSGLTERSVRNALSLQGNPQLAECVREDVFRSARHGGERFQQRPRRLDERDARGLDRHQPVGLRREAREALTRDQHRWGGASHVRVGSGGCMSRCLGVRDRALRGGYFILFQSRLRSHQYSPSM